MINRNDAFDSLFEISFPKFPRLNENLLGYLNTKLTSVKLPGLNSSIMNDSFLGEDRFEVSIDSNKGLYEVTLGMIADEKFMNYNIIWKYMYDYKFGQISNPNRGQRLKDFNIPFIDIFGLDNNRNRSSKWELRNNQITNLTGLEFQATNSQAKKSTFNITIKTQQVVPSVLNNGKWEII